MRLEALKIAIGQIGQKEVPAGSNCGPMVDVYLKSVGLKPGYSWCQAFMHWCYEQAAEALQMANPMPKTAGVLDCWGKTAVQYKITQAEALRDPMIIMPGYQVIMKHGTKGFGHTCMVESVEELHGVMMLHTIEGNSNTNGSSDGEEVVRHQRRMDEGDILGFIRYD